jgi:membrane dipeptidase
MKKILLFSLILLGFGQITIAQKSNFKKKANQLAHAMPIIDGHVDLPYQLKTINFRLSKEYLGIPIRAKNHNFDYQKARKGGLSAPFMSIYIPSDYGTGTRAHQLADSLIAMVHGIAKNHADKFALANSPADIETNFKKGLISLPMGMENGSPIGNDLKNVAYFYQRGIRYITLTHSKDNQICDAVTDTTRTWGGLSPYGREVVTEMNRLGVLVDVSHISDETFYQVIERSKAPCIASHSSCRAFTPDFKRNMTDDMLRKMGEKDGIVMISFGNMFLDSASSEHYMKDHLTERPVVSIERLADHIDHAVKIAGIDHVGFGSDFDGVSNYLPVGMKNVSEYPNLIALLLKRGYSEADIAKLCYQNFLRVWRKADEVAGK